jgi:hypothetical protein
MILIMLNLIRVSDQPETQNILVFLTFFTFVEKGKFSVLDLMIQNSNKVHII